MIVNLPTTIRVSEDAASRGPLDIAGPADVDPAVAYAWQTLASYNMWLAFQDPMPAAVFNDPTKRAAELDVRYKSLAAHLSQKEMQELQEVYVTQGTPPALVIYEIKKRIEQIVAPR